MTEREKNIDTLVDGLNSSLEFIKKKLPTMVDENYEKIKPAMKGIITDWIDQPDILLDEHVNQVLVQAYSTLLLLEALHMVKDIRKGAHG